MNELNQNGKHRSIKSMEVSGAFGTIGARRTSERKRYYGVTLGGGGIDAW
ncbi:MAG: hypothetical protein OCU18_09465 [Candidatus Syntrophoarchaeum sp.]|nr:hypothetical protein [Candidatus Syntrophoarchaeum sp.]